ncbi:MAG TPA: type IV pilus secretin PilQ [Vicinamibacterales bacterium]|nr:type IV pilus secretin PilQ [Vicinamibacterales bacterium]
MTPIKGLASLVCVAVAGAIVAAAGADAGSPAATARLKTISAKVNAKGASLVIEASEPVAYIATRPDPLTLQLDFRNATVDASAAKALVNDAKGPIASVSIVPPDAAGAARILVALSQPVAHRVRSERNSVIVDFDKPKAASNQDARIAPAVDAKPADAMMALAKTEAPAVARQAAPAVALQAAPARTQPPTPPPAPAATQPPTTTPVDSGSKKYSGHPISLDFQGADLRAVLRTFAEISGLNIVIDPAVTGTVDVALRDVPWDQALDIILRANKLGYIVDGTIVRIAPLSVLADEQSQQRKLAEEQALAGELRVLTKTLSYAKGEEMVSLLTKSALSQRGTVQIDPRTNTLIITDLPDRLTTASDLIATLDRPQPQVEIEARIVQTSKSFERSLGVQWGFNGRVDPALGNTTNLAFPNSGSLGGAVGTTVGTGTNAAPGAVNLGVNGATSGVGLALGSVNGAFSLDVALSALESSGNGRILSTPRVTTQNNVAAEMTQGQQIPIQTVANQTVTVTFKDAALTLKVTPQITAASTVIMSISLENSSPDFSKAINGIPPINTQRANTTLLVHDGETTVIGGVYLSQEQATTDRTPGLGQIPLLKWLFKRDTINDQNNELLIFITPRILKS